jgi:hypothetical protein
MCGVLCFDASHTPFWSWSPSLAVSLRFRLLACSLARCLARSLELSLPPSSPLSLPPLVSPSPLLLFLALCSPLSHFMFPLFVYACVSSCTHTTHTSAYVSIRQHTSACVSIPPSIRVSSCTHTTLRLHYIYVLFLNVSSYYMCLHTTLRLHYIYVLFLHVSSSYYVCLHTTLRLHYIYVLFLHVSSSYYVCLRTTLRLHYIYVLFLHVSSSYCMCFHTTLRLHYIYMFSSYMCPPPTTCVFILIYAYSTLQYIYVLFLYMCPPPTTCVFILIYAYTHVHLQHCKQKQIQQTQCGWASFSFSCLFTILGIVFFEFFFLVGGPRSLSLVCLLNAHISLFF